MQVTGVIAEYNPFHGGHISQLKMIRERSGADYIIAAMSGDFVQRGEPAVFDKATRTRAALNAGADLVIEIPVTFSTASAPDFAAASVALLDKLGVVTELCFGSECGDISYLEAAADVLCREPDIYKETLKNCLRAGDTYPKAQAMALTAALKGSRDTGYLQDYTDIFSSPNNILGIEYVKALRLRKSPIRPYTYKREGQSYHDDSPDELHSGGQPSASALRRAIREEDFDYFDHLNGILTDTDDNISAAVPIYADDLSQLLNEKLLELSTGVSEDEITGRLGTYYDLAPDLASRLSHRILSFDSFTGRCADLKSRSYTYARVSRALLHIILGITDDIADLSKRNDYVTYIRVLGFRKSAESLLSAIHKNSSLPIITKTAGAQKELSTDGCVSFSRDLYASHLYDSIVFEKSGIILPNEYTKPLIVI